MDDRSDPVCASDRNSIFVSRGKVLASEYLVKDGAGRNWLDQRCACSTRHCASHYDARGDSAELGTRSIHRARRCRLRLPRAISVMSASGSCSQKPRKRSSQNVAFPEWFRVDGVNAASAVHADDAEIRHAQKWWEEQLTTGDHGRCPVQKGIHRRAEGRVSSHRVSHNIIRQSSELL